jgi:hypothetical protein
VLAPQLGDLELQLLDLQRLSQKTRLGRRQLLPLGGDQPAQGLDIIRQRTGLGRDGGIVPAGEDDDIRTTADESNGRGYPAAVGRQVRTGIRQSMPSSSMPSCAAVSATTPSATESQTK